MPGTPKGGKDESALPLCGYRRHRLSDHTCRTGPSRRAESSGGDDPCFWYTKLGYVFNAFALGSSAFSVDCFMGEDGVIILLSTEEEEMGQRAEEDAAAEP